MWSPASRALGQIASVLEQGDQASRIEVVGNRHVRDLEERRREIMQVDWDLAPRATVGHARQRTCSGMR